MASHARIHVSGALYYVVHHWPRGKSSLASPRAFQSLRSLVGAALLHHKLRACAFFIHSSSDYLHYIVRIADEPVSLLVRGIENRRASAFGPYRSDGRRIFPRHTIRLLDPGYLNRAVRYLHLLPVRLKLARSASDYQWSSDRAYRGLESYEWLDVYSALHPWPVETSVARWVYRTLGPVPLDPDHIRLIERGSELDSRVIGHPEFIRSLAGSHRLAFRMTLRELCEAISKAFRIQPDELRSHSHRHVLVVARAFLFQYATQREGYKKTKVAQYLGHSEDNLSARLKRCRAMHPDVFMVTDIPEDGSLRKMIEH